MRRITNHPFCVRSGLLMLGLVLLYGIASAQNIGNYAVSRVPSGVSYNSIEFTGGSMPAWRNNTVGNSTEDDNRSYPVPIGFDFWYNGVRYTNFSVSTNGFIDFSSAIFDGGPGTGPGQFNPYGPYDADLSSTARTRGLGGTNLAIAPIYYDITTQGEIDPLGESIKYQVDGVAPNRVLTVEWIRMAVWGNISPNLNYQVKLYEGSGVIEMIYGSMSPGTGVAWSYSCGLSGVDAGTTHLIQTANNSNVFSTGSTQNNLTAIPPSNSSIVFTPPAIGTPTDLTFPVITQTSMQLNWTDVADEFGYVIYRSDDGGTTYNFITQTLANTTSYMMTDLLAGQTYYYKIYAVNEGRLSAPLLGNRKTVVPATFTSIKSGSWNDPLTWNNPAAGLPDITSAVIVSDGHTVTIDGTALASTITVGQGTSGILYIGNSDNVARTISVTGNITVNPGGRFQVNPASIQSGHTINTTGNFVNSGIIDLAPSPSSRCVVNFNKSGTQTISGYGQTTNFYLINLNMGTTNANILDVFATHFTDATPNFLTITNGTFKLSAAATVTPYAGIDATVPITGGLWLNHSGAVVNTTGGNLTISGFLRVSNGGTLNVGNLANHRLISNGGTFTIDDGTINIAGRFEPLNNFTLTNFIMSGGTLIVPTVGSTNGVNAPFTINVPGSNFEMTGGTIVIRTPGVNNTGYINKSTSTSNVLGGTLQIGDSQTPASQRMQIYTDIPLFNLSVKGTGTTAQLFTNPVTVKNAVSVASTTTLDPNNLNMMVGGNWTDNGTFLRGRGTVTLFSTSTQTIADPAGEVFKNLIVDKEGGSVVFGGNVTVDSVFTLAQGAVSVGMNTLTFNYTAQSAGTITMSTAAPFGTVVYNQPSAGQTILPLNYGNLMLNGFSKNFPSSGSVGIANTLTVPNPATAHVTAGSTIDFNGAAQTVAATTANFVYNNLSLSGSGTKTASGAATVNGSMSIGAGVTFADANAVITVKGNIANDGTHTGTGRIQVNGGAAAHTLSGSGSYGNFTMNDAMGAALSGTMTVNGALTFTAGVITTGADTVYANGPVTRTAGHVNGWLRKMITTAQSGQAITFEIGDAAAANYTPAVFTFASITSGGTLTANTVADQHPLIGSSFIDPTDDVARYWTLKPANNFAFSAASKYTAKFSFYPGDLAQAANVPRYKINRYAAGWDSAGTTTVTPTTGAPPAGTPYTNQGAGLDKIGSYAIGLQGASNMYRSIASGNWNQPAIWQRFNGPTGTWVAATDYPRRSIAASVSVQSPNVVTVNSDLSGTTRGQDQVVIDAGATVRIVTGGELEIRNGTGTDLTVYGTLEITGGTFSTSNSPAISFEAGGTYIHGINGGTIPASTWDPNSNCVITGITTTVPGGLNQMFGNFHWNCPSQNSPLQLSGNPTTVRGEFRVTSTGAGTLTLNDNTSGAKSIGGNFVIAGGSVVLKSTGATPYAVNVTGGLSVTGNSSLTLTQSANAGGDVTLNVGGNVTIATSGQVTFTTSSTNGTLNAGRDFSHTSGTMTESGSGTGNIVFNGGRQQTYTSGGAVTNVVNYTVNSGTTLQLGTSIITGGGSFTLSNGASIALGSPAGISSAAGTGNVQVTGIRTFGTGANYIYYGTTGAQSTGNAMPSTVNKLIINNSAGVTLTASTTVSDTLALQNGTFSIGSTTLTVNSAVAVSDGTLNAPNGTVNYHQQSNGQNVLVSNYGNLIFSNYNKILPPSSTIGIAGTFTPGTATGHVMANSTINYNGANQSVVGFSYYNLTTSGSGTKTLTGDATVAGMLTLGGGSFADGGHVLTVNGNIFNTVAHTGSGRIYLNGSSSVHLVTGGGSYTNIEINDENGVVVAGNVTVNGTFTLTRGVVTTSDTITIGASGLVARPTTGLPRHVNGFLKKTIPALTNVSQAIMFEIGTDVEYTPVELTFTSVTTSGTITASTVSTVHPNSGTSGFDPLKNVKRYWKLAAVNIVSNPFDATFTFVPGDIGSGTNTGYLYVKRYAAKWFPLSTNLRTSVSTKAVGISGYGDFAIGELVPYIFWTGYGDQHSWSDVNNWSTITVPTTNDNVILDVAATINVDVAAACKKLTIDNSGLVFTIQAGKTLTLSGDSLIQRSGTFNTEQAFPTLTLPTCVVRLTGGTYGFTGPAAQAVPAYVYHNIVFGGSGTKTAQGDLTVNGDLMIAAGAAFAGGSLTHTLFGNWTNNGTYTAGTSNVVMSGGANSSIGGAAKTTFSTLTVSKTADAQTITLGANVATAILNMVKGRMETGPANSVEVTADLTGSGIIIGTITQSRTAGFTAGVPYRFEGPNNLITFNAGGTLPTSVTETVTLAVPDTNTYMDPIRRYYALNALGGSGYTFKYRLHYEDGEVSAPNSEASLKLWHETLPVGSKVWDRLGVLSSDASANYAEYNGITAAQLAGRWCLSSRTIPNMQLTLTQDKTHPVPGEEVTYTITWQNTGDGNATNVLFTAFVPANTTLVAGSVCFNSVATTDYTIAGNVISFNISSLNGGVVVPAGTGTITYKVTIN